MLPRRIKLRSLSSVAVVICAMFTCSAAAQTSVWTSRLDGEVNFYRQTAWGTLLAATDKSLYAVDAASGETIWRLKLRGGRLEETDVAEVPGTDLILLSLSAGDKRSRLEAIDVLSGGRVWQTKEARGGVMALAVDDRQELLAVVLARDARGRVGSEVKRSAEVRVYDLATGRERWNNKTASEIEMMPARFEENQTVEFTFDNYRAPLFLDDKLYLFYEGITTFDARTGGERKRESFKVNENNLALTDADPIADDNFIYASGRGRVRAFARQTNREVWRSDDLGVTPEIINLDDNRLLIRNGGNFTRLTDGEVISRGSYGATLLDKRTGKTLWRYKGADKGITNLALANETTIALADRDDLIYLDVADGKVRRKFSHAVERAGFTLINEQGAVVVGGTNQLAAFINETETPLWRVRHDAPGRGAGRIIAGIAARAAALYFRYGGVATTAYSGFRVARNLNALRSTGLAARFSVRDLTTLASGAARDRLLEKVSIFGIASRLPSSSDFQRNAASGWRGGIIRRATPTFNADEVEDRLLDRLDPARGLERLSSFFLRRERMATLRGKFMYFYTNIERLKLSGDGRGLVGVNLDTGRNERIIKLGNLDRRFLIDEPSGLVIYADERQLLAAPLNDTRNAGIPAR